MSTTLYIKANGVVNGVKTLAFSLPEILKDLVTLENPTISAAVAAFILKVIPGLNIPSTTLVAAVAGVGLLSATVEKLIESFSASKKNDIPNPTRLG